MHPLASRILPASDDDEAQAVAALGLLRSGIGVGMILVPSLLPRLLGTDRRTAKQVGYLARMVGVREIALGAGSLESVRRGDDPRPWVLAQGLSDAGDTASMLLALRAGRVNRVMATVVTVFALVGVAADAITHRAASKA